MKYIVSLFRIFVALTFLFSGFVKLVDPLGSSYKFQEYFSAGVLNLEFLIPYALPFSIFLILLEIMLGLTLLLGFSVKKTVWSLLGLNIIFLFLTWYSAYYNKVTDCGCFGDAVKLSTWGTFYKNVILTAMVVVLVIWKAHIKPFLTIKVMKGITWGSLFIFLFITYYVLVHLPIIDFRPYSIGSDIPSKMEYIDDKEPEIYDFYLESQDGEEKTQEVLSGEKVMLVVSYNLNKSDADAFPDIKKITDEAIAGGYKVYALSASVNEEYLEIKNEYDLEFDMLFCDETALKTVIRANPGIVILNKGVVMGKWNWVDISSIEL